MVLFIKGRKLCERLLGVGDDIDSAGIHLRDKSGDRQRPSLHRRFRRTLLIRTGADHQTTFGPLK